MMMIDGGGGVMMMTTTSTTTTTTTIITLAYHSSGVIMNDSEMNICKNSMLKHRSTLPYETALTKPRTNCNIYL
jgi:hypothetical protein